MRSSHGTKCFPVEMSWNKFCLPFTVHCQTTLPFERSTRLIQRKPKMKLSFTMRCMCSVYTHVVCMRAQGQWLGYDMDECVCVWNCHFTWFVHRFVRNPLGAYLCEKHRYICALLCQHIFHGDWWCWFCFATIPTLYHMHMHNTLNSIAK